jgi:hypothetical protein
VLLRSIIVEREPVYRQQETVGGFAPGLFGVSVLVSCASENVKWRWRRCYRGFELIRSSIGSAGERSIKILGAATAARSSRFERLTI